MRCIWKDVPEVGIAGGTADFSARVSEFVINVCSHGITAGRVIEAGPAASGIEFGGGAEKFCPAGPAPVDTFAFFVQEFAGEGRFGSGLAQDREFCWGENPGPFFIALREHPCHVLSFLQFPYCCQVALWRQFHLFLRKWPGIPRWEEPMILLGLCRFRE